VWSTLKQHSTGQQLKAIFFTAKALKQGVAKTASRNQPRSIPTDKKDDLVLKLWKPMPDNRMIIWLEMPTATVVDLTMDDE
jgi:hypothetical protein